MQKPNRRLLCIACNAEHWFKPWVEYRDNDYEATIYLCQNCGLGQLLPLPTKEQVNHFYDEGYSAYQNLQEEADSKSRGLLFLNQLMGSPKSFNKIFWLKLALLEIITGRYIPLRYSLALILDRNSNVLDCGSGAAIDLFRFRKLGFSQLYAFDIKENPNARIALPDVDFRCGLTVTDVKYETDFFALIILNHVLEHVLDPLGLLVELKRLIKCGGYLAIAVPNIDNWVSRLAAENYYGLMLPHHIWHFTRYSLPKLIQKAGFEIIRIKTPYDHLYARRSLPFIDNLIHNKISLHLVKRFGQLLSCFGNGTQLQILAKKL